MWSRATLLELGCGWERGRVIIPIRSRDGELRGLLRYAPSHDRAPKVLAACGTRPGWARLFTGPHVSVVLDCDRAGREVAARIAADLKAAGVRGSVIDLARCRADGYDLTAWLAERESVAAHELCRMLETPGADAHARVPATGR